MLVLALPLAAWADWLCDGDPLRVERINGLMDASGPATAIPNAADGTLPGDGLLIHWRGETLQLPRTNNAGTPSYTDGRWWWRAEDADHPEFNQRRGGLVSYTCEPMGE
ncbi:hypothetical protein EVJ50_02280 [Synechococcus sp. RSCCF101]|nr:hypothetical protein EVJ50_02280 [Synechococcus sp. RSCCF101]